MPVQSTLAWRAKPRCPKHLVAVLKRAVNALPSAWLLQPTMGEVFDSIEHCRRRLQGYALTEGFDVVQTRGGIRRSLGRVSSARSTGSLLRTGGSSRVMLNVMRMVLLPQLVSVKIL